MLITTTDGSTESIFLNYWRFEEVLLLVTTIFQKYFNLGIIKFSRGYFILTFRYDTTVESVRNPTYAQFFEDNLFRLFGLNGIINNLYSPIKTSHCLSSLPYSQSQVFLSWNIESHFHINHQRRPLYRLDERSNFSSSSIQFYLIPSHLHLK